MGPIMPRQHDPLPAADRAVLGMLGVAFGLLVLPPPGSYALALICAVLAVDGLWGAFRRKG